MVARLSYCTHRFSEGDDDDGEAVIQGGVSLSLTLNCEGDDDEVSWSPK